jgi:hypothetical protein
MEKWLSTLIFQGRGVVLSGATDFIPHVFRAVNISDAVCIPVPLPYNALNI